MDTPPSILTKTDIEAILPHRDPFLFVDRIVEMEIGKHVVGILADLTTNEFLAHLPTIPGPIILEALAQVGAVGALSIPQNRGKLALLAGVNDASFAREASLGAEVKLEADLLFIRGNFGKARVRATWEGHTLAEGFLSFAIADGSVLSPPETTPKRPIDSPGTVR
jgi:3-hydroxyacyl-[acyl-carrier-protein] dehydratase